MLLEDRYVGRPGGIWRDEIDLEQARSRLQRRYDRPVEGEDRVEEDDGDQDIEGGTEQDASGLVGHGRLSPPAAQVQPAQHDVGDAEDGDDRERSEEHTSEIQSLMRISYAVFC